MTESKDGWSWDGVNMPRQGSDQQPGVPGGPPPAAPPPYAPAPPSYSEQQRAALGQGGGAPYGAIATRPGIIALRPLAFGEFFDGAFRAIQHNPRVMFGLSLLVSVVLGLLQAAVFAPALAALDGSAIVEEAVEAQALGALLGGSVLTALVSALATIVLNGLLVVSVSQSILGRRVSVRSVWDRARPQLLRLIGLTIVTSALQFAMVAAVVVGAVAFFGAALVNADRGGSPEGMIVAAIAGLFIVGAAAAVFALFFYVKFSLAAPALMMERAPVFAALGRSWRLTQGFFWRNLGVLLVAGMVAGALSGLVSLPISLVVGTFSTMGIDQLWVELTISTMLSSLVTALVTPFLAAITALLYVDIRMRKEALDVELSRAVEAPA